MNTSTYIDWEFLDHLSNKAAYKVITEEEATQHMQEVARKMEIWLKKYATGTKTRQKVSRQELHYLLANFNPSTAKLPVFYLTLKVHKSPWTTRSIVFCSGSLLYHLGVWIDVHLQKVTTTKNIYIKIQGNSQA